MDLKNEWMKKMWCAYALEYDSAIYKKGIFFIYNSVDEPGWCYTKWNKPAVEGQVELDLIHTRNLT